MQASLRGRFIGMLLITLLGAGLIACGGSVTAVSKPGSTPSPAQGNFVLTAGDAPVAGVLSAEVSLSALALTSSQGSTSLLNKPPLELELSHLGAISTPLTAGQIAAGTYTGLTLTASAASITYLDPNNPNQTLTTQATLSRPTVNYSFAQPITIGANSPAGVYLDFDLGKSFDWSGATLTFTPALSAASLNLSAPYGDIPIMLMGVVQSVGTSSFSLEMLMGQDYSFTVKVNASTEFDDNLSLSSLAANMLARVEAELQPDGTLLATEVDAADGGLTMMGNGIDGCQGIIASVSSGSGGAIDGYELVSQGCAMASNMGEMMQNGWGSGVQFGSAQDAMQAGAPAFDASQVFPGQSVQILGGMSGGGMMGGGMMSSSQIENITQTLQGTLAAPAQGNSSHIVAGVQLSATEAFAMLSGASQVQVWMGGFTHFGSGLSGAIMTNLAAGTPLVFQGYMTRQNGQYVMYAMSVAEN